jgi:formylglycine-generating enzyme required for sulfatase activity/predicted Ser/Thr protein kinase
MERLGRYEIIQELGRGAMGVVYKARDPNIDRLVAIKMISLEAGIDPKKAKDLEDRFQREARAAGRLSHPNIVTIYDASTVEGQSFLAMEYIEGENLQDLIEAKHIFSLKDVASIGDQVAKALDYAHQQGIVHRDIKPANIMLTATGQVKVADFGIARITESSLTRSGLTVGTPSYMSPEQVAGQKVDGRSDQFSLGATLYELLSGEKAFLGDSISTVVYRIMNESPIPLRQANPTLPEAVDAIIRKAMAKNPADRYPHVADLGRDLLALESGAPTSFAAAPSLNATYADSPGTTRFVDKAQTRALLLGGAAAGTMESVARGPVAAVPLRKSRLAMIIGGGLAVVALGLGLFVLLRPTAPPAPVAIPAPAPAPPPVAVAPTPIAPPPPEEKPAPKLPQLQELLTVKDVRPDGRPVGPSTQFLASDPKVVLLAFGTDLKEQRRVRVRWFDPDGKEIPSSGVPKLVLDGKGGWRAWAGLTLAGSAKAGRWKVEFTLGDDIETALSFNVTQPVPSAVPVEVAKAPTAPPTIPPPAAGPRPGAIQKHGKDEAEMVYIPPGTFTMGDTHGDGDPAEKPASKVTLNGFWIDRFDVTFDQFAKFVQAANYKPQGNWEQQKGRGGNHPVVNVTWNDALAYCRWVDKRLPTEAEWEYSARGQESRKYPWGDQWDPSRARFRGNRGGATTAPVGNYPTGASPFGVLDMAGNVWQWTASLEKPYPYVATDGREDLRASGSRVSRGGSWLGDSEFLRTATRDFLSPTSKNDKLGFRCTQNP